MWVGVGAGIGEETGVVVRAMTSAGVGVGAEIGTEACVEEAGAGVVTGAEVRGEAGTEVGGGTKLWA